MKLKEKQRVYVAVSVCARAERAAKCDPLARISSEAEERRSVPNSAGASAVPALNLKGRMFLCTGRPILRGASIADWFFKNGSKILNEHLLDEIARSRGVLLEISRGSGSGCGK